MKGYLSDACKISILSTTTQGAAGSSAITSSALDMAGYDGVLVIVPIGTLVSGAVTSIKAKQDVASGGSYTDLLGSAQTIADTESDKLFAVDIQRTQKQFLKFVVSRATQNATIGGIIAIQYNKRSKVAAITQGAGVSIEQFNYPAEGTA